MAQAPDPSSRELIRSLVDVAASGVTFWSGAGISGDAPTQGPLGLTLTHRALAHAFDDELPGLLEAAYKGLGLSRTAPRLEAVLEVACAEHGTDLLRTLLHDLIDAPSNPNHVFFAEHLRRGGQHITANFDTCIERAHPTPVEVVHLHGSLSGHGPLDELGARLGRIEQGFDPRLTARLDLLLRRTEILVVVGYSGLDYFDVDHYWRDASRRGVMRHLKIVWVDHADTWGNHAAIGASCRRKQLRVAADLGGSEVFEVQAPTREVLDVVARTLHIGELTSPPPWVDRPQDTPPLPISRRRRATTRFLFAAGLHRHVTRRLDNPPDDDHEALAWAAQAAWAAGRYRIASRLWARANPGEENAPVRLERQAACRWLRGQLRVARKELTSLLDAPEVVRAGPVQRLIVAETLGRVLVHMRRLPDSRLFVRKHHVEQVVATIDRAVAGSADPLPVHLRARVASVRGDLVGVTGSVLHAGEGSPERDFDEYEALSAMLNYEHRRLRERATNTFADEGRPQPREYRRLRTRHSLLGATADAARVPLLPGAARCFPVHTVVAGILSCDFTTWHTVRLVALHLVQRARCARQDRQDNEGRHG